LPPRASRCTLRVKFAGGLKGDVMREAAATGKNPLSVATLVCGVLAVLVFFIGGFAADLWPLGMLLGLAAAVLGFVALRKTPRDRQATLGLALGALVVVLGLVWIVLASMGIVSDT
jgi:membrane associated rhomboid family serine protease